MEFHIKLKPLPEKRGLERGEEEEEKKKVIVIIIFQNIEKKIIRREK